MLIKENGFTIIELMIATAVFSVILIITTIAIIGISQTYERGTIQDLTQQTTRSILTDISNDIEFNDQDSINISNIYNASTSSANTCTGDICYFCIGDDVYAYTLDKYLSTTQEGSQYSNWGLVRYSSNSCPGPDTPTSGELPATWLSTDSGGSYAELLSANERLGELYVQPTASGNGYNVTIEVAYGENDLLADGSDANNQTCVLNNTTCLNGQYTNGGGSVPADNPAADYAYSYRCQSGSDSSFCATASLTTTIVPRIND